MVKSQRYLFLLFVVFNYFSTNFVHGQNLIAGLTPFCEEIQKYRLDSYDSRCHFTRNENGALYSSDYIMLSNLEKKMEVRQLAKSVREAVREKFNNFVREIVNEFITDGPEMLKDYLERFSQEPHAADVFSKVLKILLVRDDVSNERRMEIIDLMSDLLFQALVADGQRMADYYKGRIDRGFSPDTGFKYKKALFCALADRKVGDVRESEWFQHAAAYMLCYGKEKKVRKQLKYRDKIFAGARAIHAVASKEILALMIKNGASLDLRSPRGYTPLFAFSASHDFEGVAILLRHGANVNVEIDYDHGIVVTPLAYAVCQHIVHDPHNGSYHHAGNICREVESVVRLLLHRGAALTPLARIYARCSGCCVAMDLLGVNRGFPR
ncbi:hypothetical protein KAT92_01110 [Candidatus Babeliales bacterium]|nr:hypothetical protein [Candidatus Babeliales bacterium]